MVVALPFQYTSAQMDAGLVSARSALWLMIAFIAVNAISFFFGFSTFERTLSLFHLTFHAVSGLLLGLTVIHKGHYLYLWYIVLIFGIPQVVCDTWSIGSHLFLGRRRK